MLKLHKYILLFLTVLLFFPASQNAQGAFIVEKIFYMSRSKESDGIVSLKKNIDKIDIIGPQFYGISEGLKLVGGLTSELEEAIKETGVKVMPLVVNAGFKQDVMHNLLLSNGAQKEAIDLMVNIAKEKKYIGWQFDFENISYLDRDLYSAFIEKTAKALHENDLMLSVAAVVRSVDSEDTDFYRNWSGAFDYERISNAVDFISLMTYDDPDSTGPIASLSFINNVLEYVKDKIPPKKLSLGIPLYNWGWRVDPIKKITYDGTYKGLSYIKLNFKHTLGFDKNIGESWLTYYYYNKKYQIWFQDKNSFENKLEIASQNNFRGFSAWVLGIEDTEIWDTL